MEIDKLIVLAGGIGLIGFIYVWFLTEWGKRANSSASVVHTKSSDGNDEIEIIVDGGYRPDVIRVKRGQKVTLSFLRKDPSSCLDEVILPDFKISSFLPLNEKTKVSFVPGKSGTFDFSCGMRMFHGKLIVEGS